MCNKTFSLQHSLTSIKLGQQRPGRRLRGAKRSQVLGWGASQTMWECDSSLRKGITAQFGEEFPLHAPGVVVPPVL